MPLWRNETLLSQRSVSIYQLVPCCVGIVYSIPFSYSKLYVGQSGRCVNDRLREQNASLKSTPSGNLAVDVEDAAMRYILAVLPFWENKQGRGRGS